MQIDLFADIACPWCYIGERRLKRALEEAGVEAQVRWRPYQLQPGLPAAGMPWADFVERKFGAARAEGMFAHVAQAGAPDGVDFRFDRVATAPNTRRVHAVILAAQARGRMWEAADAAFRAYFTDGRDLADDVALAEIGAAGGLTEEETRAAADSGAHDAEIAESEALARSIGVTGVPFYVFDGKYAVSGAQPPAAFRQVLDRVRAEAAA